MIEQGGIEPMTMRQGLAILNEARKRAPMTYAEHAQCDSVFQGMNEVFAQNDAAAATAAAAAPAIAAGEVVGGEN